MATDATASPTTALGIPKYNTAGDPPSGKGFNAAMEYIDDLIEARGAPPGASGVKVWNNTTKTWDTPAGANGTKFLRDDGTFASAGTPGYGTTLPGSPTDGQEHILVDSLTAPSYQWRFRYNAGSTSAYKWEFIGGAPGDNTVLTGEYVASVTFVAMATPGPLFALPRAGDYDVELSAAMIVGKAGSQIQMSYDIGATAADQADALYATSAVVANGQMYNYNSLSNIRRKTGLAAVTLTAKYLSGDTTATTYYIKNRVMRVTPVRVS